MSRRQRLVNYCNRTAMSHTRHKAYSLIQIRRPGDAYDSTWRRLRFIPQRSGKFSLRVTAIWRVRQRQLSSSTFSDNFHRHRKMRLFLRDDDPKRHLRVENSNHHRKIAWFFCDDIQKGPACRYQGAPYVCTYVDLRAWWHTLSHHSN